MALGQLKSKLWWLLHGVKGIAAGCSLTHKERKFIPDHYDWLSKLEGLMGCVVVVVHGGGGGGGGR